MVASPRILVVDDDAVAADLLREVLTKEGYRVQTATQGSEAIQMATRIPFDMVITDLKMPDVGGLEVVRAFRQKSPQTIMIVITAFGSFETAIEAIQNGAYDYISKPFKIEDIKVTVQRALNQQRLIRENLFLPTDTAEDLPLETVIGNSPKMLEIYKLVARVARTDTTVLIQGESGTGKELIARAIHSHSHRAEKPYVAVNCAALPEGLLETELFGHTKGAFTGAWTNKKGLFLEAEGGTCFLDEIGDITPSLQAKLLRVLQEHEVRPVGGTETIRIDVRILAATNKDLETLVKAGRFREDAFYRLHVVTINLPPLRDHPEDIPLLANHFIKTACQHAKKSVSRISKEAMEILTHYHWPGNIRQLENVIERAVTLTTNNVLMPSDISEDLYSKEAVHPPSSSEALLTLEEMKRRYVEQILNQTGGNQSKAAEVLGINRKTLYRLSKHREQKSGGS
ncbi:MAG: sigma-54-dependent Fis family transcriptional regulator [Nitrospirae bacterium]|nr:sigma-54-dependent Fis family transcriptional regulator [Nitrospirota bacterium]